MLQGQLIGILGLAAITASWALAVVLYRVGQPGSTARMLCLLLAVEGVVLVTAGFPNFASGLPMTWWGEFYQAWPSLFLMTGVAHHLADAAVIALYPPFLALTLDTKLTRPFARRGPCIVLAVSAFALALAVLVLQSRIVTTVFYLAVTVLFVYALAASIHAWRTASRGLARERAGIFALAFGLRDLGWGTSYAIAAVATWNDASAFVMTDLSWLGKLVYALGTLLAVPLIAWGVLRGLLFDIDLKVRWTIKQSTLATLVVTLVFLLSEGADRALSAELGSLSGLLAAAVVVFCLAPLQRFADSIASSAMPNTNMTPEYAAFRKMQIYEAAVAEALGGSGISEKERALLVRLRDSLDISEADADAIEHDLAADDTGATPVPQ